MIAAGLLLAFVTAKIAVLRGLPIEWSAWAVAAYFWQDVLAAAVFGGILMRLRALGAGPRILWTLYWLIALYAALNVPVERALFTPLTWPMLRAARGPLLDSLLMYLTWTNGGWVALTVCAAAVPFLRQRAAAPAAGLKWPAVIAAAAVVAIGPAASARLDTLGLDRNVLGALASSAFPKISARASADDWRASPFGTGHSENLSNLRGVARRRNVVLVSLESTASQYLGVYGARRDPAPNLTTLASNALVFENAYAVYPESIKGLFSILCAAFPAFDSSSAMGEETLCDGLPAVLEHAGYTTALFHSGRFGYLGMESVIRNRGYEVLADAGDIGGQRNSSFGVDEPSTVARMLSWIDTRPRGAPFFLTYLPIAGHHPYEVPAGGPFPNGDDLGRYLNAVHYSDEALGALIEGVRQRGLEDETLWIIVGDHGEAFGQHQANFGHTFFLYDENVRVPFLIAAPGALTGQRRIEQTISLIDTAPTILDLLDLQSPAYQGRSALGAGPRMALFFTDYSLGMMGLRDGPMKFIYELDSKRSKMFDLERDPGETNDIALSQTLRARWYKDDLQAWAAAQKTHATGTDARYP